MSQVEFQYTRLYLKKYLVDNNDPRKNEEWRERHGYC